jgi:hypothetical protein
MVVELLSIINIGSSAKQSLKCGEQHSVLADKVDVNLVEGAVFTLPSENGRKEKIPESLDRVLGSFD